MKTVAIGLRPAWSSLPWATATSPEPVVEDAEIALPVGVAGSLPSPVLADREAVAIGLRGLVETYLGAGDIAEFVGRR